MLPLDDPSTIESAKSKIELAPVWKVIVLNDPVQSDELCRVGFS